MTFFVIFCHLFFKYLSHERLHDLSLEALRFNLFLASLSSRFQYAWMYSFMGTAYLVMISTTCSLKWVNELQHEILSQLIIFFHFGNHFVSNHLFVSLSNYLFSACRKFYWFYSAIHSVSSPKKSFEVNTSNNWLKYLKNSQISLSFMIIFGIQDLRIE